MSVEWSRTLLLLDPEDGRRFGFRASDFEAREITTLTTPYFRINEDHSLISEIRATGAEALIFTRNDDMPGNPRIGNLLRELRVGYTTISAIDREFQGEQATACARDLLDGKGEVQIPDVAARDVSRYGNTEGTFSLIFDFEQFGCARYAMPRLLPILESSGIRATFFITGFIAEIYPRVLQRIADGGHEIGIHGKVHEFLQGRPLDEQIRTIEHHANVLRDYAEVWGANFIFRMDGLSPEAILNSGIKYFVLFRKHLYFGTRYLPASGRSRTFRTPSGDLYFVPVSVETYGLPCSEVRGMIDSAWNTARREGHKHISILMHPFKDGTLERIADVRALIDHLTRTLKLRPLKLHQIPLPRSAEKEAVKILYRWDEHEAADSQSDRFPERTSSWWAPPMFHSRRTENIADALEHRNVPVVFSGEAQAWEKRICIYPDIWPDGVTVTAQDPIGDPGGAASNVAKSLRTVNSVQLEPASVYTDLWNNVIFQLPRTWSDVRTLIKRLWNKLRIPRGFDRHNLAGHREAVKSQ
jgi:peptidoglycan/xylan/chitin deacetylase (PgdA/CDA1 family)